MQNCKTIHLFTRYVGAICLLLIVFCITGSCTRDAMEPRVPEGMQDARVVVRMLTPGNTAPRSRSLQTPAETVVEAVDILVFYKSQQSGDFTFFKRVQGSRITHQQDGSTQFEAAIETTNDSLKLVLLTNSNALFDTYTPGVGQDEASVKAALIASFPPAGMTENLPMYGEMALPSLDAGQTNIVNVTVLRAVARVDVRTELDAGSPAFSLREVMIYRANDRYRTIPEVLVEGNTMRVSAPTVPASASALAGPIVKTSIEATDSIGGLYLPESLTVTDPVLRQTTATTIVVGGLYDGDTEISYYRLDFNPGVEGHPFGQVLRNYLYLFTVKRVSARGWPTADQAANNTQAFMTVDVKQWEDFTTDIYYNGNYLGVSRRNVLIPYPPGYIQTVYVESNMTYSIEWVETPSAGSVSDYNVPLTDGYFTATILRDPSDGEDITQIRIGSDQSNVSQNQVTATLRLRAGETVLDIAVVKGTPGINADGLIQIMSTGTSYGSLGDYIYPSTYSQAMRQVLDYNFSPTSPYGFNIPGFLYLTLPTSYSAATSAADVATFKRIISNVDILLLAYGNYVSPQVTDMLYNEWLVENQNRVLWVTLDVPATFNAGIVNRLTQEGLGTWRAIGADFNVAAGYRTAQSSDLLYDNAQKIRPFFDGPFGTVPMGVQLFPGDATAGVVPLPDAAQSVITPLVYNNNPSAPVTMSVGVETGRGVVYYGEAQLFDGGFGMSNLAGNSAATNGTIVSAPQVSGTTTRYFMDVLNANIWAWAVDRVLHGGADQ